MAPREFTGHRREPCSVDLALGLGVLIQLVIGCFLGDDDIVDVAFF